MKMGTNLVNLSNDQIVSNEAIKMLLWRQQRFNYQNNLRDCSQEMLNFPTTSITNSNETPPSNSPTNSSSWLTSWTALRQLQNKLWSQIKQRHSAEWLKASRDTPHEIYLADNLRAEETATRSDGSHPSGSSHCDVMLKIISAVTSKLWASKCFQ